MLRVVTEPQYDVPTECRDSRHFFQLQVHLLFLDEEGVELWDVVRRAACLHDTPERFQRLDDKSLDAVVAERLGVNKYVRRRGLCGAHRPDQQRQQEQQPRHPTTPKATSAPGR